MRVTALSVIALVLITLTLFSCKREVETYQTESLSDYMPLQTGKYITYRLDSLVFTNLGRTQETHSYREKDIIDTLLTDNLNRPSYRVYRFITDTSGVQPWQSAGTYFITPTKNTIEVIDNNLRTIRLIQPIQQGTTWKGNRYLPDEPYSSLYTFNNDDDMGSWDFTIDSTNETLNINGKIIPNIISVSSANEMINVPIKDVSAYASETYSVDKYAKNIGLVYQEYTLWEYQPNPGGASPYQVGFGVKRTILDHN